MSRRGYAYAYAYGGSYACSYCNHTLYPQAAGEFFRYFNEVDFRFLQIPDATIYLLGCFILLFFSFQRALAAPCRVHVHDSCWCLGTAALKGAVPRSRACQFRTHQRKETTHVVGKPSIHPGRFLQMHVFTHNEHPRYGLSYTRCARVR